jgi:hypothetical protein
MEEKQTLNNISDNDLIKEEVMKYTDIYQLYYLFLNSEKVRTELTQLVFIDKNIETTIMKSNDFDIVLNDRFHELCMDIIFDNGETMKVVMNILDVEGGLDFVYWTYDELMDEKVETKLPVNHLSLIIDERLNEATSYLGFAIIYKDMDFAIYPVNTQNYTLVNMAKLNEKDKNMSPFSQLIYLFKNGKVFEKEKIDETVLEAIQLHNQYINSIEAYKVYELKRSKGSVSN